MFEQRFSYNFLKSGTVFSLGEPGKTICRYIVCVWLGPELRGI